MNRFHRWFCRSNLWRRMVHDALLPWALKDVELAGPLLEVGPGPGLTTDVLRHRTTPLTAVEIDPNLARSLKDRLQRTNVDVILGDATAMPFGDAAFSRAVSFTMLHHVPDATKQDQLLAEVCRVLRPGGIFVGSDSTWSVALQLIHLFDTMVLVDPDTFGARLEAAGFMDVHVDEAKGAFRFRAQRPQ